ncbi:MAG: hypothetical protein JNM99_20985 [Verrucomicrobiaceae bacterium]|nr:hypothetical protein [Verrucomicrobiaceae bacterium]
MNSTSKITHDSDAKPVRQALTIHSEGMREKFERLDQQALESLRAAGRARRAMEKESQADSPKPPGLP